MILVGGESGILVALAPLLDSDNGSDSSIRKKQLAQHYKLVIMYTKDNELFSSTNAGPRLCTILCWEGGPD